jgi:fructose-1,6-bisphosphatase/inositol monophosphatase family enzyme
VKQALGLGPDAGLAIAMARAAGDLVRAGFGGPLGGGSGHVEARRNGVHDVVTPLDAAAEELISVLLAGARPGDGLVGEETRGRPASGTGPRRTWIVDPIDGTVGFVSGLPFFSVSVALLVGDRIATGAVHDPVHRETFVAEAGAGGWLIDDAEVRAARCAQPRGSGGRGRRRRLR